MTDITVRCEIQAVIEEIIRTEHVPVRVNGPMGGESILAQGYDHLLMIAGGVAVSTLTIAPHPVPMPPRPPLQPLTFSALL